VEKPTAENHLRVLYSRAGSRVVFDDDNQTIPIATSSDGTADGQAATQVFLDQKNKLLEIKDEAGNSIKLDSKGITLYSAKDLHMEAQGNVTIKGTKIDLQ
ncbi:MAG TPA: hypothetical protein PKW90_21225, partial [Myxococcota bacterium]|nr:hypothetical protein [Myxococcota bacterium]